MVIWLVLDECVCGCYSMNEFHPDIPLYLYLYLNSIFTNIRWVCGGVISLPLHQPPTSESCLPVALDWREDTDGTKILKCFHSWSKELLNEKNEIEENAELDCLRDYQGLIKAQDGFIEPQFPIWLSLSVSFPFCSFLPLTNSLFRNFRFPRYHHPASDSH